MTRLRLQRLALAAIGVAALAAAACATTAPHPPRGMSRAHDTVRRSLTAGYSNAQSRTTTQDTLAVDALADVI